MKSKKLNSVFEFFGIKVLMFFLLCIIVMFIGVITGFIINYDSVLKVVDFKLWQYIFEIIGGT